ncbi:hypothetical protein [Yoonia sp. SS1-5]|uniref:Ferrochelatase n=1 Tax=Yoonia rhodophyticola TaxID=3137370 RepID=A0AAN0MDI3_9RHOB
MHKILTTPLLVACLAAPSLAHAGGLADTIVETPPVVVEQAQANSNWVLPALALLVVAALASSGGSAGNDEPAISATISNVK